MQLAIGHFFECPFKKLNPSEVQSDLVFPALLSHIFPIIHKFLGGFLHALIVLQLLVVLADVMLHVGELEEVGCLCGFSCGDFDKLMKNAGH